MAGIPALNYLRTKGAHPPHPLPLRLWVPQLFRCSRVKGVLPLPSTHTGLKAPGHLVTKAHCEGSGQRGESHVSDQRLPARARDVRNLHQLQRGEEHVDGPHQKGR